MAGSELGVYYISVLPSTAGVAAKLSADMGAASSGAAGVAEKNIAGGISGGVATGSAAAKSSLASLGKMAGGLLLAGGLAKFAKSALDNAEAQRRGQELTNTVIASTGGVANVTSGDVAKLAGRLRDLTGITAGTVRGGENMLLTFKNIRNEVGAGNDIFDQATKISLDMSKALGGDVKGAALMVGKALNDPAAGLTRLMRVGVTFTDAQKRQIKAMTDVGNTAGAQKIMLRELNSEFGGAATSMATASDKFHANMVALSASIGTKMLPVVDGLASAGSKVVGVLNKLPGPVTTIVGLAGSGALAYALFGGAIKKVAANVVEMTGAIGGYITSVIPAVGATGAMTEAMTAEGVAAKGAATSTAAAGASAKIGLGSIGKIGGVATAAGIAFYALGKGMGAAFDRLEGSVPAVDKMTDALTAFATTGKTVGALRDFGGVDAIAAKMKTAQINSTGAKGAVMDVTNAIMHVGTLGAVSGHTPMDNVVSSVNSADKALAAMVASGNAKEAALAVESITAAARRQGMSQAQINHQLNDYNAALTESHVKALGAATATDTLGASAAAAAKSTSPFVEALNAQSTAASTAKTNLDMVASAAKSALGIKLAVPQAQDAQQNAKDAFTSALSDARANGYRGDFMTGTDQTSRDIRAKYFALEQANADLVGAWQSSGMAADQLKAKVGDLANGFANTTGVYIGKNAIDDYNRSLMIMVGAMQSVKAEQDKMLGAQWLDAWNATHPKNMQRRADGTAVMPSGPHLPGQKVPRASGGPVNAGQLYRVNEEGMEFFRPNIAGTIIPVGAGNAVAPSTSTVNIYNPVAEPASTSLPRIARQLAAQSGGR